MPNLTALKAQLKIQDQAIKELNSEVAQRSKRRDLLLERVEQEELKALGLVPGAKYRMIPKDRPGDILEGTFKRFHTVKWNSSRNAVFRCPQTGRFKEQMRHLRVDEWEFERVNVKGTTDAK